MWRVVCVLRGRAPACLACSSNSAQKAEELVNGLLLSPTQLAALKRAQLEAAALNGGAPAAAHGAAANASAGVAAGAAATAEGVIAAAAAGPAAVAGLAPASAPPAMHAAFGAGTTAQMQIPSSMVGLVIGKGGETIRCVALQRAQTEQRIARVARVWVGWTSRPVAGRAAIAVAVGLTGGVCCHLGWALLSGTCK